MLIFTENLFPIQVCKVTINEGGKSFNELINIKMTKFGKAVITDVPNHRNGKNLFVCAKSKQQHVR